ncbi:related to M.leprae yfcA protein [Cephalotrichum gorgonifer]|uniref:Related to M.leprae yfcA protein n=1 Tax=Cephalotrichum gorgonifer TaxID=2041049 RepID=A0AAE8N0G1_9PEZI|nr:related to M.leprae yfcA protein [Cephalotrichum gorgonifer]
MASSPACLRRTSRLVASSAWLKSPISTSSSLHAGHNKWSKIRHDKGAADRKRSALNILLGNAITEASRKGGPDKNDNPALATAIATAKAANVTSEFIARAISRGQVRTQSSSLENLTLEALMPGNIAVVIDVQTDSKLRSLQELNSLVRKSGGKPGSTLFHFEHCGRIVVDIDEGAEDDVVSSVIEEDGVLDFDIEEDEVTIWTEAGETSRVAGAVRELVGRETRSVDLMWRAKGDMLVSLDSERAAEELGDFLGALQGFPEVAGCYINAVRGGVSEEAWVKVQDNLPSP